MNSKAISQVDLKQARHSIGLYSIKEICEMFNCSRHNIDIALNDGKLRFVSPNNKSRYIYINEFLQFMDNGYAQKNEHCLDPGKVTDNVHSNRKLPYER